MAHHLDCLTHYQNEMEVTWTMDEAVFNFGWSTPLTYQVHSKHTATYALNQLNAPLGFSVQYYLYNIFILQGPNDTEPITLQDDYFNRYENPFSNTSWGSNTFNFEAGNKSLFLDIENISITQDILIA